MAERSWKREGVVPSLVRKELFYSFLEEFLTRGKDHKASELPVLTCFSCRLKEELPSSVAVSVLSIRLIF